MTEPSVEVLAGLKRVRKLLSDQKRWTKNMPACSYVGTWVLPKNPRAVSWCVIGAIEKVGCPGMARSRMMDFVKPGYARGVDEVNDHPNTTHAHILKWLDTVIAYDTEALKKAGKL